MFEVITSEASYLKSLEILASHFMNSPDFSSNDDAILSHRDKNVLFSDILPGLLTSFFKTSFLLLFKNR